jgi:hypothetical protein
MNPDRTTRSRLLALMFVPLLLWGGTAIAQDVNASEMVRAALQAIQMVDQNRTAELWDGATPAARKRLGRAEFVNQLTQQRAPLGAPQQRTWVAINRQMVTDPDVELAGQYLSVEYETRFAAAASKRELVSFHLERDGVWRFSGYVLK